MAKLYLLAFAGLLLAAQLASAAEPSAADPAHKHPKPPSNSTTDGKPTKPPGNHTDLTKPGKPSWNHTALAKPTKPGSNHTNLPKASDPSKTKNVTNTPWSKPFKPAKGSRWNKTGSDRWNKTSSGKWNKSSNANHTGAGGVKTAGRHGNKGGYGGKLLGGRKNFFLDPYTPMFTKVRVCRVDQHAPCDSFDWYTSRQLLGGQAALNISLHSHLHPCMSVLDCRQLLAAQHHMKCNWQNLSILKLSQS
jgi:hypothetical protein